MRKIREEYEKNTRTHGGSRPNSGRPKLGKKKYLITCLPEHIEAIRQFIYKLHNPSN